MGIIRYDVFVCTIQLGNEAYVRSLKTPVFVVILSCEPELKREVGQRECYLYLLTAYALCILCNPASEGNRYYTMLCSTMHYYFKILVIYAINIPAGAWHCMQIKPEFSI
jgi:hypothetical protein